MCDGVAKDALEFGHIDWFGESILAPGVNPKLDCSANREAWLLVSLVTRLLRSPALRSDADLWHSRNRGAIPSELLRRRFEPSRSARRYARRGEGLGLGLYITKAIAWAHGGRDAGHSGPDNPVSSCFCRVRCRRRSHTPDITRKW